MGIWVRVGSQNLGDIYLKNAAQNAKLYLGLYTNDLGAADLNEAVLAWLVESTNALYARKELLPASWVVSDEVSTYPEQEFDAFGSTVYGCFIATSVDNSGKLLAIHKFDTPIPLLWFGDKVGVTPILTIT